MASIFTTGESLEDIDAWAMQAFPDDFGTVKHYFANGPIVKNFKCRLYDSYYRPYDTNISAVRVGCIQSSDVYARINPSNGRLELYHAREGQYYINRSDYSPHFVGPNTRYLFQHWDLSSPKVTFSKPFLWLRPDEDEVGAVRFETLIRYLFLTSGRATTRKVKFSFFKEHFRHACGEITDCMISLSSQDATVDRPSRPQFIPQQLLVPMTARAPNRPTYPSVTVTPRPRTIDEMFPELKDNIDQQIDAAQTPHLQTIERLRTEIQALKGEADNMEAELQKDKADLAAATEKTNLAEEKARKANRRAKKAKQDFEGVKEYVKKAEEKIQEAEDKVKEAEEKVEKAEDNARKAEEEARKATEDAVISKEQRDELKKIIDLALEICDFVIQPPCKVGHSEVKAAVVLFTLTSRVAQHFSRDSAGIHLRQTILNDYYTTVHSQLSFSSSTMAFPPGSLEDVEAWAKSEFSAYFAALSLPAGAKVYGGRNFDGEYVDGKVVLQLILVRVLEVGWTAKRETVYARFIGVEEDVELFVEQKAVSPTNKNKTLRYIKPLKDLAGVGLQPPFHHPIDTGHAAGVDRLETLIRYFCLKHGEETVVLPKLGFFKTHFRAACRDVARATGAVTEPDGSDDDNTPLSKTWSEELADGCLIHGYLGDSPPGLIEDTDPAGLGNNPAATKIFAAHVHAMDESYHDFKTGMLQQLGALQALERNDMAQLQAQIRDLELKLSLSEEIRMALDKQLDVEKANLKTATEETEGWKAQYEGLKAMLQGALGRRF
ncbi:hypothetical protein OPT61_g6539 [Boeremia exigua]|uniref:Uncharacterized protein n=1 Tax=Boeremia exigua TaxID=749465 RepID=A0ACC2I686_9PLEO|nr:hypothetical protein OPT61_g6539 [Boeremia exigua]